MKQWFEVDTKGLSALQHGKDKSFIIRELVQNAWDENIKNCELEINQQGRNILVTVKDDNPEGFRNLRDAYTLFGDTTKRRNAMQRGRFNLGEKQIISICNKAMIRTTKGTILFDNKGRHHQHIKTDKGTVVQILVTGTKKDCENMVAFSKQLLVPENIDFFVNGKLMKHIKPIKSFDATLMTEIDTDGFLKRTRRKTKVNLIEQEHPKLYEMGIPVMDIDCKYGIDIQQKIPLSFDRDSVNQTFLRELYVEVLNNSYEFLTNNDCSQSWIRLVMSGKNVSKEAIEKVLKSRYGDKFVVANPFDEISIDEAIAHGYSVIRGSEMSKEEWANIKQHNLIASTSEMFGTDFVNAPKIEPNDNQRKVAELAKKIAKRLMGIDLSVSFVKGGFNMVVAQYGSHHLTFNVSKLGQDFFDTPLHERTIDLILHELGHEAGHHTEENYHKMITMLGAKLTMLALTEPEFFRLATEQSVSKRMGGDILSASSDRASNGKS